MSETEIRYYSDGFDSAVSVFNEVYDDLVKQKSDFEDASQNLLQGWQGKGFTATNREIEDVLDEFTKMNDDLKSLIKDVLDALEENLMIDEKNSNEITSEK